LGEKLKGPLALPNLGALLSDPGHFVRFNALVGLSNIAREGACTLSPEWTESDVAPKYRSASRGGNKRENAEPGRETSVDRSSFR